MKNGLLIATIAVMFSLTLVTCKKEAAFVADTTMVEVNDSLFKPYKDAGNYRNPQSMVYDSVSNSIFVYLIGLSGKGFELLQYNLTTNSLASVYINTDASWHNSNGSEGKRLYIYNNQLWVPGGASNPKIMMFNIGNFTATLAKNFDFSAIDFGGKKVNAPYDMTQAYGNLYIADMYDAVFYGDYPNLSTGRYYFATSETSHGTGIITVTIDNTDYIMVKCGGGNTIELRSRYGTFVRSVPITGNNSSALLKDSKQRVYFCDDLNNRIYRFSPDLLTKETFTANNFNSYYGLALKEDKNNITIFCNDNVSGGHGIGMLRLPL